MKPPPWLLTAPAFSFRAVTLGFLTSDFLAKDLYITQSQSLPYKAIYNPT